MDEELKDYYVPQIFRKVFCEHSKEQPRERGRKDRMKKIGFDNDKYLKMQSEHIRERISKFDHSLAVSASVLTNSETNFIWNLAESYLMTTTLPVFFQDLSRTASCAC